MLGTSLHYLEFFRHVEILHSLLQDWQHDASPAFGQWNCIFPGVTFKHDAAVFASLCQIAEESKVRVVSIMQRMCVNMLTVTERQLVDFLPGGRYHNVQDPELWDKMRHSKLTNLVGEEAFGDLDFSLFKRRHANVHHHSTISMLKRNKSVSSWLCSKDVATQDQLLRLSAQKSAALRQSHKELEREAVRSLNNYFTKVTSCNSCVRPIHAKAGTV